MKTISLIIPAHNEEKNIYPFYDRVKEVFSNTNYFIEMVFIDDGSMDDTYAHIMHLTQKQDKQLMVKGISFSRNFGKEAAMLAGLKQTKGEYIAYIDADLQQDPIYVKQMASILDKKEDIDIVAAYQKKRIEGKGQTFLKECFYKLINRISEVHFEADVSDFRTFRRSVKEAILSLPETNRFSKGLFAWVGFKTETIPYEVKDRKFGSSSWSIRKLFHYAMDGIIGYSMSGLKISIWIGAFLFAGAFIWLIAALFLSASALMTWIPFLILLVGAFQLFGMGMLGEYLGRTYTEVKERPSYIVRSECHTQTAPMIDNEIQNQKWFEKMA